MIGQYMIFKTQGYTPTLSFSSEVTGSRPSLADTRSVLTCTPGQLVESARVLVLNVPRVLDPLSFSAT